MWRGLADVAAKYLQKGKLVYIEGKLRTRNYEDKEGIRRYITEVVVDNFTLLGRKSDFEYPNPNPNPGQVKTNSSTSSSDGSTSTAYASSADAADRSEKTDSTNSESSNSSDTNLGETVNFRENDGDDSLF